MKSSNKSNHKGINPRLLSGQKDLKKNNASTSQLFDLIKEGNITALSKAITLVESTNPKHQEQAQVLIQKCLPHSGNSVRIGITGVPGVGKSTFIEALGMQLIQEQKRVAVLAVDPTSSISKGSILGDKTRMENLSLHPYAFIRPSASGDTLGGVAQKTREVIILCEAAGFDTIIVETVGVGQSETAAHAMVDFFLLLKLAGAGDELQGIKRGIIEMADAIVINKADGDNKKAARMAVNAFAKALHLYPPKESDWTPKVHTCSALENEGIVEVWELIQSYTQEVQKTDYFTRKRQEQQSFWFLQTVDEHIKRAFYDTPEIKEKLELLLKKISENTISPFAAARQLLGSKSS